MGRACDPFLLCKTLVLILTEDVRCYQLQYWCGAENEKDVERALGGREMASAITALSAFSGWQVLDEEEIEPAKSYAEELAFVEREDGRGLEGAIIKPTSTERKP